MNSTKKDTHANKVLFINDGIYPIAKTLDTCQQLSLDEGPFDITL